MFWIDWFGKSEKEVPSRSNSACQRAYCLIGRDKFAWFTPERTRQPSRCTRVTVAVRTFGKELTATVRLSCIDGAKRA
eukprot:COSAG04_NODE_19241_length_421_cov_0.711180_1_plen_77_part_10